VCHVPGLSHVIQHKRVSFLRALPESLLRGSSVQEARYRLSQTRFKHFGVTNSFFRRAMVARQHRIYMPHFASSLIGMKHLDSIPVCDWPGRMEL